MKDEKEFLHDLGARIKAVREAKGLTLRDLEAYSGLDNGHLARIESGQKKVQSFTIYRIAAGLGVPYEELLTGL